MLSYFYSIGGLAALNVAATQLINSKFNISKNWARHLISWILPVLVSVLGLVFGLGIFADFGTVSSLVAWGYTLLVGLGTGLVSNGLYDLKDLQDLWEFLKALKLNK